MKENDNEYLEQLYKGFAYSSEQFYKAILFVSSGALGISITFLDKIIDLSTFCCNNILVLSWIFEAITIILFTINHYVSLQIFNSAIKAAYNENAIQSKSVKYMNLISIMTLSLGILLLIIFIFINIKK